MLTAPESDDHLVGFYRRTRPDGPGWARIAALSGGPPPGSLAPLFVNWVAGVVVVYAALFGIGHALLGSALVALMCVVAAIAGIGLLLYNTRSD